jgi:GTPase
MEEGQATLAHGTGRLVAGELMLIDRAVVRVVGGSGGSGASSFARFKYKPKGGPDGGDGGNGGSVYVKADPNLATLLDYRYRTIWQADRGEHGKGKTQTGASASDVYLPIPPGTVIRDAISGELIGEVLEPGDTLRVARGGRGGRGNARFATSTHQAPREWEPGESGEDRQIELVLKLIADVGLVGEPNAGKSTLLSVVSAARPKIADYPFTTLEPNLGVVALSGHRSYIVADIPGIIEGAHEGRGLGFRFLQHVERTRVLAFLVPLDDEHPQATYDRLREEVRKYSEELAGKRHLVLLTKRDLLGDRPLPEIQASEALRVLSISSATGEGVNELKEQLWKVVEEAKSEASAEPGAAWEEEDSFQ